MEEVIANLKTTYGAKEEELKTNLQKSKTEINVFKTNVGELKKVEESIVETSARLQQVHDKIAELEAEYKKREVNSF